MLPAQLLSVLHRPLCMPSSYPPFSPTRRTGHPHLWWLLQFESHPPRPPLGFRNGPALRYVQISRMTIIKTPTSYFACASPAITAATLSSIWFQPSI
jgi:hypothetical protein